MRSFKSDRMLACARLQVVLWVIALFALCIPAQAARITKQLAPGVVLVQEITKEPVPLIVNVVEADTSNPAVKIKAAIGQDIVCTDDPLKGREKISSLAVRKGALVAINADFFPFGDVPTGDPLNVCIVDGELVSEPAGNRAVMAVLDDGKVFFDVPRLDAKLKLATGAPRQIDGINRPRSTNQVVLYTHTFGPTTQNKFKSTDIICTSDELPIRVGHTIKLTIIDVKLDAIDTQIPKNGVVISGGGPAARFLCANAKPGDIISVTFDIKSASGQDWTRVKQAVGGGPWILKDGKRFIDLEAEGMGTSFSTTRHPRTAVGTTADGKLMMVTVDGRQSISAGISLPELSELMKRLGCVNAINLDGGGSTTMAIRGIVANSISGSDERAVANGLLVFSDIPKYVELPKLAINCPVDNPISGTGVQLQLVYGDDRMPLAEGQMNNVVWGVSGAVGFVDQSGYFIPIRAKKGKIQAAYGSQIAELEVTVVPGPPADVKANIVHDKTNPLRSTLTVVASDVNGNRVTGKDVILNVIGGKADVESGVTNGNGEFATGITWDGTASDRRAIAVIGDLAVEVQGPPRKPSVSPVVEPPSSIPIQQRGTIK